VRDAAYLNWRYRQNPLRRYRILAAERGDSLAGYAILSLDHGRLVAEMVEWLVAPGEEAAGLALLAAVTELARREACALLQVWMLPQHTLYVRLLRASGFIFAPRPGLPHWMRSSTPFLVRPGPAGPPPASQLDKWFLSMGDHDYY
jgi:hypothetical protein